MRQGPLILQPQGDVRKRKGIVVAARREKTKQREKTAANWSLENRGERRRLMGYKSLPLASIELPQPRHEAMAAGMRQ